MPFISQRQRRFPFFFKGLPFSGLAPDGEVLIKGAQGITGTPQAATFTIGVDPGADYAVYCFEYHQFPDWTGDHGDP